MNQTLIETEIQSPAIVNPFDDQFHRVLRDIQTHGFVQNDRTGVGTKEIFGTMLRFDISNGTVPAITSKRVATRVVIRELIWMVSGRTNVRELIEQNVHIWSQWPCKNWLRVTGQTIPEPKDEAGWKDAVTRFEFNIMNTPGFSDQFGDLGPVYGHQWRRLRDSKGKPVDQLASAIERIRITPDCRRNIVEAWNVADLEEMQIAGLPPCHKSFQFNVSDGKLSMIIYQRSCDMFLGVPFNILFYSILLAMVAQVTGLERGTLTWMGGSCHIYSNHVEQVDLLLSRTSFAPPTLELNPSIQNIDDFRFEDVSIVNYQAQPAIKAQVAV